MQTDKTYAELLAWQQARIGLSGLPREWTPNNWNNDDNDCAVFQSTSFFGDMRYYVVSQFYNDGARNGQLVATARPGALACFKWPGSGDNFDHIGLVTSGQDKYGNFSTIEANTSGSVSGHQVAAKVRNVANVVGFVMPQYAGSTAGGNAVIIKDTDVQIYEYFMVPGDTTVYISLNRAGYWGLSAQDKQDYDYYLGKVAKVGVPKMQTVKNPSAFGPKLR